MFVRIEQTNSKLKHRGTYTILQAIRTDPNRVIQTKSRSCDINIAEECPSYEVIYHGPDDKR